MLTATRGDLRFDVHVWGPDDGVPVLLLHGFPQTGGSWAAVATRLAEAGFRCVAPDQRGYSAGARPARRRDYVLPELVADAVAVVDDVVGPQARVHLVGHDWGAVVAWSLAARHPERIATLTAVSVAPLKAYLRSAVTSRQGLASWYTLAFQLPWLPEWALGTPSRMRAMLHETGQTRERAERDTAAFADRARLRAALNWYRATPLGSRSFDPPVTVPTRFVWSDGDTALTRQSTAHAQAEVTGPYEFIELAGVSHWIPDEVPDQLAEIVAEHAASHPA